MPKIKIKKFGPIKQGNKDSDGWIDIKKVSIFIGNQGSGKSCIAKLVSTFMWIEKVLVRGDYAITDFSADKFRRIYCGYHRIENYFFNKHHEDIAEIEYEGDAYHMKYNKGIFKITEHIVEQYHLPQIMYVPTERNFISIIKEAKSFKSLPDSLLEYLTEFNNAKSEINEEIALPINGTHLLYDKQRDIINISGHDYKVKLTEASSGFQSLVPLFLVSWYLANTVKRQTENPQKMSPNESKRFNDGVKSIWADISLTDEQRRIALSALSSQFNKSAFINIVEEPELNLYPDSQRGMIYNLLELNNLSVYNKLIITTHSPYIINELSLVVKAEQVQQFILNSGRKDEINRLNQIIPVKSLISEQEWVVYEIDNQGTIYKLNDYHGLPSDDNYLNVFLAKTGSIFSQLLELEDEYARQL